MPIVKLENVRISYPNIFEPKQIGGQGDLKFSAAFLIPKNNPGLRMLEQLAQEEERKKFPKGRPNGFKVLPIKDGDTITRADAEGYQVPDSRYAGVYVLNTSNKNRPSVVDQNLARVVDPTLVTPGMYVNVVLSVYAYSNVAKGVTCGLESIQLVGPGPRLDNRPNAEELFAPIGVPENTRVLKFGADLLA